jgi:hypothetical protein
MWVVLPAHSALGTTQQCVHMPLLMLSRSLALCVHCEQELWRSLSSTADAEHARLNA